MDAAVFCRSGRLCSGTDTALRLEHRAGTERQPNSSASGHSTCADCISPKPFLAFPIEFFLSRRMELAVDRAEVYSDGLGRRGDTLFVESISRQVRCAV